ncbi:MAG: hypothetical protein AAFQ45_07110 [Pseudomonadota bacterium]
MLELTPFAPMNVVLLAVLNPVVAIVGFMMGRTADQWGKCIIAGFAAALAGSVLLWFAVFFGLVPARGIGGEAGVFVVSIVAGTIWATLAYAFRRRTE